MKKQVLSFGNQLKREEQKQINGGHFLSPDDCGGCIAWADSRDDGTDRTLKKWQKDLDDCRAASSECQNQ